MVAGCIIGTVGFIGVGVVPAIAIGVKDSPIAGIAGCAISLAVSYLGFMFAIEASHNYSCCNNNSTPYEGAFVTF